MYIKEHVKIIFLAIWVFLVSFLLIFYLNNNLLRPDPDTQFLFNLKPQQILGAHYQHPMQWLWFLPLPVLLKMGLSQQWSIKFIFSLVFLISSFGIGMLAFKLFRNLIPTLICSSIFIFFPTTQHLASVLEDNILAYPLLIFSIYFAIPPCNKLYNKLISLFLWGISFHVAFWTSTWFPFIIFLILYEPNLTIKAFILRGLYFFSFAVLGIVLIGLVNDLLLGRNLFSFFNQDIILPIFEIRKLHNLQETMKVNNLTFFQVTMADAFFGILKIPGLSQKLTIHFSKYIFSFFFLFHLGIIVLLIKINLKNLRTSQTWLFMAFVLEFLGQMVFIYVYKDIAYNERFDFYCLISPIFLYLVWVNKKTKLIFSILTIFYSLIGILFWISFFGFI
jgi:hypothetical protein